MAQATPTEIILRLICTNIPPIEHLGIATEFGLQDKAQQLHAGVSTTHDSHEFTCTLNALFPAVGTEFDFSGRFVHGPKAGRFIYFGYRQQGATSWIRRWKLPLYEIPNSQIVAVLNQPRHLLVAHVVISAQVWLRPTGNQWQVQPV